VVKGKLGRAVYGTRGNERNVNVFERNDVATCRIEESLTVTGERYYWLFVTP
jgi:hypothetical protein